MRIYRAIISTIAGLLAFTALIAQEQTSHIAGDAVRIPYQAHRIYHLRCLKGSPLIVELPLGETVKNVWMDRMWFNGEAVPGSGRVLLKAQNAEGTENQKTTVHIETNSDLRISAVLECLPDSTRNIPPVVYSFFLDGQDEIVARNRLRAEDTANAYKEALEALDERYKASFTEWKTESLGKVTDRYKVKGKAKISRVMDDGIQTWIYAPEMTELQALRIVNKDKQAETVNFEYLNGAYVANRVLADGERFVLSIGKKKTNIRRKE